MANRKTTEMEGVGKQIGAEAVLADFLGEGKMIEIPCSRKYCSGEAVYVCTETGLVRAKEVRSSKEIARIWSEEVFGGKFDERRYTSRIPAVLARQTYVAAFADENIGLRSKEVCDIGAGEGQFLEIVASPRYGALGYGIEPSEENSIDLQKNGFECFCGTVEDYCVSPQLAKNRFDVVTMMWTLCNTSSAIAMIQAAYDILKTGGKIVVAEGSRILVPFRKPLNMYFSPLPVDLHPYHFSVNSLTNLLKVIGFTTPLRNRYLDSDCLCVIAEKGQDKCQVENFEADDWREVLDFFDRWDRETGYYL